MVFDTAAVRCDVLVFLRARRLLGSRNEMLGGFVHAVFHRLCRMLAGFNDLFVGGIGVVDTGFEQGHSILGTGWCGFRQIVDQLVGLT